MKLFRLFVSLFAAGWVAAVAHAQPVPDETASETVVPAAPIAPVAPLPDEPEVTVPAKKHREFRGPRRLNERPPVVFFKKFVLHAGETVSEVVVIGGDAQIDGTIDQSLTVVGGSAQINGSVGREAVVVGGGVTVGPKAHIGRHSVFIGGPFAIDPGASINHDTTQLELGDWEGTLGWARPWVLHGLLWGRLLTLENPWPWFVGGAFLIFYALLLALFPKAVASVVEALETRPVASLVAGLLGMVLWAPLLVLVAITVIGVVVIPCFPVAIVLLLLFGKAGFLCFVGRNVTTPGKPRPWFFTLAIGGLVLAVAYMIPLLGLLAFFVATLIGFGGAILAVCGTFKSNTPAPQPNLVPVSVKSGSNPASSQVPPIIGTAPEPATPADAPSPAPAAGQPEVLFMRRAGFWNRFAAALLDLILISFLIPLIGPFFVLAAIIYFVGMWTWRGTTIGSIVMGLKIVRTNGTPINFGVALVRSLSSLFSAVVLFLGFLWVGWDREKQGWHDKIAGTTVVRMPRGVALV